MTWAAAMLVFMSCGEALVAGHADHTMTVGYDEMDGYVVFFGFNLSGVEELEVVADSDSKRFGACQQTVVIAFSSAYAIARAVVGHSGYDYKIHVVYVGCIVSVGFLNAESSEMGTRTCVGKDFKIKPVDTREEELLATLPLVKELVG